MGQLRTARFIRATKIADPAQRLRALAAFRSDLDDEMSDLRALIRGTIAELRAAGVPLASIAHVLNVTVSRAHQLSQPPTTERTNP